MFRDFPDDFRYALALQESVAVAMADGFAQATGRPGLVNLHSAAGVGHGLGNVFTAFRNRTPLVVVAGQQARSLLVGEPFLFAERPAEFGEPYVKFSREPARAADVPATLARAIHVASTPPCGPVLVSVPVDDWDRPAGRRRPPTASSARWRATPTRSPTSRTAWPRRARPAFVVGGEVDRDGAFDDVVALAERHAARVYAAPMSPRCGFPERHRLFGGFLPRRARRHPAPRCASTTSCWCSVPRCSRSTPRGRWRATPRCPRARRWSSSPTTRRTRPGRRSGTSIVTGVRHGVRALLAGPPPPERPLPAPRPAVERVRGRGRGHHRGAAAPDPRGPAAGRLRGRRGGPGDPRADARPPALRPPGELLHLRQRRAGARAARGGGDGDGRGASGWSRSSGTARRCTGSRRCGRRRSRASR